jgi:hypothetical protein
MKKQRRYQMTFNCCSVETNEGGIIDQCDAHGIGGVLTDAIIKIMREAVQLSVTLPDQMIQVSVEEN